MRLWKDGPVTLPARVSIDGYTFTVGDRAMTTAELIDIIGFGDWWGLIPTLVVEDEARHWLNARMCLHRERFEMVDVWSAATQLGGALSGTGSWWAATRLLGTALSDWMLFDGWCLEKGFSPLDAPLWRTCSAAYQMLRNQRVVPGQRDQTVSAWERLHREIFDAPLNAPRSVPLWSAGDEAAAFRKGMAAIGSG